MNQNLKNKKFIWRRHYNVCKIAIFQYFFQRQFADETIAVDYKKSKYNKKFNIENYAHRFRRPAKIGHRQNKFEFQRPLREKINERD